MTRNAHEAQTYLHWHDEVVYLLNWTPGATFGTLSARVADDDFAHLAATPWSTGIRMDAVAEALEQIAAANVMMHHDAEKAARSFEALAFAA